MRCPIFAGRWHALFLKFYFIYFDASTLHGHLAWGLLGECGLDCDWQLACNEAEFMSFVFKLNSEEELYHSPHMANGMQCVNYGSQLPKGKN